MIEYVKIRQAVFYGQFIRYCLFLLLFNKNFIEIHEYIIFNKQKMYLVITDLYVLHLENGGDCEYQVFVFHTELEEEKSHIVDSLPLEIQWNFIDVPKKMFDDFVTTKRYPKEIYYRLAAPYLLPTSLEHVLYMDVDTVVINRLSELFKTSRCLFVLSFM